MDGHQILLRRLLEIDVCKVGEFRLKSSVLSPIYIDLRGIIAHPDIVKGIANTIHQKQQDVGIDVDVICGVPYTALPIASAISVLYDIPTVIKRKESKDYGTKRMVEGITQKGLKCLIIEDIVSSGSSVIETAEVLRNEGLIVTDCIVVLNRMQGAQENIEKAGIKLHSIFTIYNLFDCYCSVRNIDESLVVSVKSYLETNSYIPIKKDKTATVTSFSERSESTSHPIAKELFKIIDKKKSNLCVAIDTTNKQELLQLANQLGPYVCMIKTHIDIIKDFNKHVTDNLSVLAEKHDFLIFEDRKFADIGNTVVHQYNDGIYNISEWADIVTVHGIPGDGVITALKTAADGKDRACVLIASMSSKGALTDDHYQKKVAEMAESHPDFVIGFISQNKITSDGKLVNMCPGVNINDAGDSLGQQYNSPEVAVENGADIVIVGRGICAAPDIVAAAMEYQSRAYKAYLKKCGTV